MRRDIVERGRDVLQVLNQYEKTVKPSFESYTLPTKQYADIIVGALSSHAVLACSLPTVG
jgi:uridine kinase